MAWRTCGVIYLFPVLREVGHFLRRFALVVAIGFLLAAVLDYSISAGLRRANIRKYATWNDIYRGNINADLIIIGSSRAWCGYNTYLLDSLLSCNSYNLGLDGHAIDFQLIRYDTYLRYNSSPKLILLNTDFLSTLHNTAESQYEREQFFPYINDSELMSRVSETKKISIADRFIPLKRYFGYREEIEDGILSFFGKNTFGDGGMYKGYRGNNYAWDRGMIIGGDTIITERIDSSSVQLLEAFSARVINEGIGLVFVKSPVYSPLLSHFSNISQSDSIFAYVAKQNGIPIFDFYDCSISQDSSFFYNPSHLNKRGSDIFTSMLCDSLRRIDWFSTRF